MQPPRLAALVEQLLAATSHQERRKPPNPCPPGVPVPGRTTDLVLCYLREHGGFRSESQIAWALQRSHSATSHALLFLVRNRLVVAVPDMTRNPRYRRYRAIRKEVEHDVR